MRRILIVGCGAMGGIIAAHLQRVAAVTVLDVNAAHVDAIRRDGLRVEGPDPRTVPLPAVISADELAGASFDAVIFLTKSGQTAAAWAALRTVLGGSPLLVTLQNGMGNIETCS
jgi:2-dehydropantoate 2-reductase